jgi:hypothetical protein
MEREGEGRDVLLTVYRSKAPKKKETTTKRSK